MADGIRSTVDRGGRATYERSAISHLAISHLAIRLLADLILFELLVEIAARRADHFGGLRDVPAVLAQLADQEHPLGVLLELPQRARPGGLAVARLLRRGRPAARGRPCGRRSHGLRQIRDLDRIRTGHDDHPLDRVPQLADVAAPAVAR